VVCEISAVALSSWVAPGLGVELAARHLGLDDQAGILGVQHDTMSTSQAAIPSRRIVEAFRVGEGVRLPRQQHQTVAYRLHTKNL
jgi:hypothetical protein